MPHAACEPVHSRMQASDPPLQQLLEGGGERVCVEGGAVSHAGVHCSDELPHAGAAGGGRYAVQAHQQL